MTSAPRFSAQTRLVVEAFLTTPTEWRYGYDLSRETDLKSGTLYPILMRLADYHLVESSWEPSSEEGRPPRHMYRLTGEGAKWARGMLPKAGRKGMLRPAANESGVR